MQHLDEGTIHAWLDGALPADEAARAELHVASCETCSEAVAEARGLVAAASRILTALDDAPRVGARRARGDRGARGSLVERWRIAAVVALVIAGGGALALAVRSTPFTPTALEVSAERGSDLALVTADSPPAAEAAGRAPNVERIADERGNAAPGRGAVGAASGNFPAQSRAREGEVASELSTDSAPLTLAQLDGRAAAAPPVAPAAAPARTDDTARLPFAVADANRPTAQSAQAEARSSVTEKVTGALGAARRSVVDAPARFAEPGAPQAHLRAVAEPSAPHLLTEEHMVEDGRVVVRRVYRVEETLVTLDERSPRDLEKPLELEQRRPRVEAQAYEEAARVDSTTPPISTIRWVDSRGAVFALSGAAPQAQLERIRKLLGY